MVYFFLVVDPDTSVVVLLFSLRNFWLGRMLNFTRTLLRFLLPEEEMSPVQPEAGVGGEEGGVGAGEGVGGDEEAAGGVGSPGGGVVLGARRACADEGSRRAFVLLGFLCPGLFSGQLAYGSIAKSGVGRRKGRVRFGFLVVELVELARLDDEEDGGFGAAKVTFLTFESFRRAFP